MEDQNKSRCQLLQYLLIHVELKRHFSLGFNLLIRLDEVIEHLRALLDDEGHGPGEEVHEVRKQVGMRTLDELLDVERVVLSGRGVT